MPASRPPRTAVRSHLEAGATEAMVEVVKGFEPGAAVKITDGERVEFAVIKRIDRRKIVWDDDHALKNQYHYDKTTIEGVEIQLQISSRDAFEIHDNLTLAGIHSRSLVQRVNEASKIVRLEDLRSTTPAPFNFPVSDVEDSLRGGQDGAGAARPFDFIGHDHGPTDRKGLHAFEDIEDVGLICAPDIFAFTNKPPVKGKIEKEHKGFTERDIEAVQHALVNFCERRKTCFAILDPPPSLDADQVIDWRSRFDSNYAACYYPWLKVLDPLGKGTRAIPPSGHVAGLYARTDLEQGVHKAPANETLNDVVGLTREITKDTTDLLSPEGVNCIRALRGRGIRVWGARTLTSNALWEHVSVRRLFIMIERSIAEGTEWAVFEDNDWSLWKAVERQISRFLTRIWKEGMLRGAVPEEAFFVKCDETTNPPEARDAGEFLCEIGVAAVRPAEFIVFRIGQRTQDIITEEPVS